MTRSCPRCGARYPAGRVGTCPVCLLEAEIPPALVGDSLELLEEIGRGGMGTVYKARHLKLGRTVAVKFLAESLADRPEFRKRFESEARALAMLSHPGIVAVHDFGQEGDRSFIVMEFVEGRPLSESLPLPVDRALEVALQACDALSYAHRHGVVHRDDKPANILLDAAGRVKLSDFGIARLVSEETASTATLGVIGTPQYMAPEALAGAAPDPRMDVYSLGVVLLRDGHGPAARGHFEELPPALARILRRGPRPRSGASLRQHRGDASRPRRRRGARGPQELEPDERNWLRAVALLQTLATAAVLWALLLSVTPKVMSPGDVQPLIMLGTEALPDGRIVSRGRFETWPTLAALAAVVLVAHGLLRRHWRQASLERPQPQTPVRESRWVLVWGVTAVSVYGARKLLERGGYTWAMTYVPILGGLIEVAALFCLWLSVLQAWRTSRPLTRELALWGGFALALCPPVIDLASYLSRWRP